MNKLPYLIMLFFLPCLTACDDIFVENISDNTISIVSPGNNTSLSNRDVSFVWEPLEGAETYQVIIVSPSFDHIQTYVCDSVTEDYKMKITLGKGEYEWSIQARNSAYVSLKSTRKFEITEP